MPGFPQPAVDAGHVEDVPRRIRAVLGGRTILDTTRAVYRWEWPFYPQYYVPVSDIDRQFVTGTPGAVTVHSDLASAGQVDYAHVKWDAVDAWFEEDEQVFVHPRNPYVRVDALRSTRPVSVALDGVLLAESRSPVMVFETGLPTRYYLDPTAVRWEHLLASDTQTGCPYKGRTTGYWSVRAGETVHPDLAWTYDFPTRQLLPIAGLVAFYNEKLDITLDGELLPRPDTHFS
jgi:uncharacterized protein (DUF427 family)